MRRLKWSILLCLLFFGWGCSDDNCGSPPPVPVISFDDPVSEGSSLILIARGNDEHDYVWTGPEGFNAEGRIQEIENAQVRNSGDYTVQVSEGDCPSVTNTAFIEIDPLARACETPIDELAILDPASTTSYTSVSCRKEDDIGLFQIRAMTSLADGRPVELILTFPEPQLLLINRSYTIVNSGDLNLDQVSAELVVTEGSSPVSYTARAGKVYLRIFSDGTETQFCNLSFFADNGSILTGTSNIKCTF